MFTDVSFYWLYFLSSEMLNSVDFFLFFLYIFFFFWWWGKKIKDALIDEVLPNSCAAQADKKKQQ